MEVEPEALKMKLELEGRDFGGRDLRDGGRYGDLGARRIKDRDLGAGGRNFEDGDLGDGGRNFEDGDLGDGGRNFKSHQGCHWRWRPRLTVIM